MSESAIANLPRSLMLGLSFGQGLLLLFLWRAVDGETWPSQTPALNFPLWTFAIVWPGLLLLCLQAGNALRALTLVSLCTALLLPPAAYVGWQASPVGAFPVDSLTRWFAITMTIACFKALLHLQPWTARTPLDYAALFTASWRNFLVVALSALLVGLVFAVLLVWGLLFAAIDIDFFLDIQREDWFLFPVLAVAFGAGVLICRRLIHFVDGVTRLLEGLMRLLLPLTAAIAVLFLAALPFAGLSALWDTGQGTGALMSLNAFMLFFLNAVYQTGRAAPYPRWAHRLLQPAIALLPILSGLALYGLYLRVDQYGWSLGRCWGFTICVLLTLFSLGYAWIVIRRRDAWPRSLGRINIRMGWLVFGLMILVNTPVLDFRALSVASQMGRVEAGELDIREFDYRYAWRHLARPAHLKMQALIEENTDKRPDLVRVIKAASSSGEPPAPTTVPWARVLQRPEPFDLPPGLRSAIESYYADAVRPRWGERGVPVLLRLDLNADGAAEYVFLVVGLGSQRVSAECFYQQRGRWRRHTMRMVKAVRYGEDLTKILKEGKVSSVAAGFEDLRIGDLTFRM